MHTVTTRMRAYAQSDGRPRNIWIVNMCLSCEDIARQSCAMVPRWQIFGDFLRPVF